VPGILDQTGGIVLARIWNIASKELTQLFRDRFLAIGKAAPAVVMGYIVFLAHAGGRHWRFQHPYALLMTILGTIVMTMTVLVLRARQL